MNKQVDFYLLNSSGKQARQTFACRLAEKVYRMGMTAYVGMENQGDCVLMDDLLWSYSQGSFIPHCLETQDDLKKHAVIIGQKATSPISRQVYINLRSETPDTQQSLDRVAEIIDEDDQNKKLARIRYRQYQDAGFEIKTHKIK